MSAITNVDMAIEGINGELYESHAHLLAGQPLDIGRSIYVRLCREFDDDFKVEVFWDHYLNTIRVTVERGRTFDFYFDAEWAADSQRVQIMRDFIAGIRGKIGGDNG